MSAEDTIRDYYEVLARGEPLAPFFAADDDLVKFGVSETLSGYEAVAEGLREQTETTDDWHVESSALAVTERDDHAWFADEVDLAWTDVTTGERFSFDTRWSGTLERRDDDWSFVGLHVSAPHSL